VSLPQFEYAYTLTGGPADYLVFHIAGRRGDDTLELLRDWFSDIGWSPRDGTLANKDVVIADNYARAESGSKSYLHVVDDLVYGVTAADVQSAEEAAAWFP
jgi:hypothetical protein